MTMDNPTNSTTNGIHTNDETTARLIRPVDNVVAAADSRMIQNNEDTSKVTAMHHTFKTSSSVQDVEHGGGGGGVAYETSNLIQDFHDDYNSTTTTTKTATILNNTYNEPNLLDSLSSLITRNAEVSTSSIAAVNKKKKTISQLPQTDIAQVEVLISGMTCAMCSSAIENALNNTIPNIHKVNISLTTDIAEIEFQYDNTNNNTGVINESIELIKSTIEDIGYDVSTVRLLKNSTSRSSSGRVVNNNNNSNHNNNNRRIKSTVRSREPVDGSNNNNDNKNNSTNNDDQNDYEIEDETIEERWERYNNHQLHKLLQRRNAFYYSLIGTIPILFITMILPYIINMNSSAFHNKTILIFHKYHIPIESLLLWILATPVQFICGFEFYKMSYYSLRSNRAGMDVLVALGTSASYLYALVGIFKSSSSQSSTSSSTTIQQHDTAHFFETSAVLICFVLAGKWMQAIAVRRTSDALSHLMTLQTKTAIKVIPTTTSTGTRKFNPLITTYIEQVVPIEEIIVGDIVKIIRGASIPTDGTVLYGELLVNESMVTGESIPVLKTSGNTVLGGTVCVETSGSTSTASSNATTTTTTTVETTTTTILTPTTSNASSTIMSEHFPLIDDVESNGTTNNNYTGNNLATIDIQQSIGAGFIEVTGVGSNTALAQIVRMVQQAQTRSVPIQSFADSVSAVFVPTVCAISVVTYLVWYALCSTNTVPKHWYIDELNEDASTFSLMFAIACLVISCPCALGLATPTAVMVGTGVGASKCGVLMKGGQALEIASHVTTIILDKTGTITKGTPIVSDFIRITRTTGGSKSKSKNVGLKNPPLSSPRSENGTIPTLELTKDVLDSSGSSNIQDTYLLWLLASLERTSEHPLAKAVVSYAEQKIGESELLLHPLAQPTQFHAKTGRGCRGTFETSSYYNSSNPIEQSLDTDTKTTTDVVIGNRSYASNIGIEISREVNDCMKILERQGKTSIFCAVDGHVCVVLGLTDEIKSDAKASIYYLREKLHVDVWMVTGDNNRTAIAVAQQLNIPTDRIVAKALPADKLNIVKQLQATGCVVCMVGDGVNDSPALAQADVGMSVGAGASDIATEASDMVLVKGDMASVCTALHLSRAIFQRIQWNFILSLVYNILGIPIAAGVFYPLIHQRLPPTVAAVAMALSSISVVISSLTLRFYQPPNVIEVAATATAAAQSENSNSPTATDTTTTTGTSTATRRQRRQIRSSSNISEDNSTNHVEIESDDVTVALLSNDHYTAAAATANSE